jgi:phospholipid/cholesterol/gamma-HCH transport system permease protein
LLQAVGDSRNQPMPKAVCTTGLSAVRHRVELLGRNTADLFEEAVCFLSFLGLITITIGRSLAQPRRFRFAAMCHHLEQTGLRAMPIIGLLGFLIGVVISYQGAQQLQQFGAELYTVNLLGVSILREIGVLMTAIIIAGRSGSAFTAQIGTMKVNQEIDALQTMGLSPSELLVLPRVVALVITLPLLTLYSNLLALLGGALMCWAQLGISLGQFLHQLQDAVDLWTLWVGLIKAPVFAFVIGVVGCYQGLRVEGSAESVGALTTRSVVHAIFLVILLDAIFSVMFAWLGI